MEFYFVILVNTTKNIKNRSITSTFNQLIVRKQLFKITTMCEYDQRFIVQFDSQQSISNPKHGNVTSTPQPFTFGPQFLAV